MKLAQVIPFQSVPGTDAQATEASQPIAEAASSVESVSNVRLDQDLAKQDPRDGVARFAEFLKGKIKHSTGHKEESGRGGKNKKWKIALLLYKNIGDGTHPELEKGHFINQVSLP